MAGNSPLQDDDEVAFFAKLGEEWWDPSGPMRALHSINPVRIAWLRDQIIRQFPAPNGERRNLRDGRPLRGVELLDIGCGAGILSEPLARLGARVTGLDPSKRNIEVAKAHAEDEGIEIDYRAETVEALAGGGARFDVVLAMEVVEHVPNLRRFIGSACTLVRPGGMFAASTFNRTLKSFALGIIAAEYVLRWVPRGAHRWERFVRPGELEDALRDAGLRAIAQTGVVYDPLRKLWRESADMGVNYMLAARRG